MKKICFSRSVFSFLILFIASKPYEKVSFFLSTLFLLRTKTTYTMSQVIDQDETYIYEILQEKDCIECATILAQTFTKHNPYELYMKTSYEQFYTEALSYCKAILNTNLSVIARHKQTNEIHGIVQGADAKTFDGGEDSTSAADGGEKRVDPILELMDESERRYLEEYEKKYGELKENAVVHILMAGVRSDCSGRGELFEKVFL